MGEPALWARGTTYTKIKHVWCSFKVLLKLWFCVFMRVCVCVCTRVLTLENAMVCVGSHLHHGFKGLNSGCQACGEREQFSQLSHLICLPLLCLRSMKLVSMVSQKDLGEDYS